MKRFYLSVLVCLSLIFMATKCNKNCTPNPRLGCGCTLQYDPVCGCDGKTYGNACEAYCARIDVVKQGECGK